MNSGEENARIWYQQISVTVISTTWADYNQWLYSGFLCTPDECALGSLQPKVARMASMGTEKVGVSVGFSTSVKEPWVWCRSDQVCYAWNEGRCYFLLCRYRHVCLHCQGEHQASSCTSLPPQVPPPLPSNGPRPQRHMEPGSMRPMALSQGQWHHCWNSQYRG